MRQLLQRAQEIAQPAHDLGVGGPSVAAEQDVEVLEDEKRRSCPTCDEVERAQRRLGVRFFVAGQRVDPGRLGPDVNLARSTDQGRVGRDRRQLVDDPLLLPGLDVEEREARTTRSATVRRKPRLPRCPSGTVTFCVGLDPLKRAILCLSVDHDQLDLGTTMRLRR